MTTLAVDTSGMRLSLGLQTEGAVFIVEAEDAGRHSTALEKAFSALFEMAGAEPSNLDMALCLRGPGSFTGLRIGFSAVEGLGVALGIRTASIPTLDCAALPFVRCKKTVIAAIDSKRKQFYTAIYRNGKRVTDYLDARLEEIAAFLKEGESVIVTGRDTEPLCLALEERGFGVESYALKHGGAQDMLNFAARKCELSAAWDGELKMPLYIRPSDAEEKRLP